MSSEFGVQIKNKERMMNEERFDFPNLKVYSMKR
jgi:hypothetical protein